MQVHYVSVEMSIPPKNLLDQLVLNSHSIRLSVCNLFAEARTKRIAVPLIDQNVHSEDFIIVLLDLLPELRHFDLKLICTKTLFIFSSASSYACLRSIVLSS
ncbi:hypothetical protein PFISCL1PPCAC_688 [Pristionchus fissidentatus]|uniref:Uncharacterized protein n=1 Tax=Pristionchus fissidentatus TaxID=1538716 RepID=A0AAV5UQK8_9BILA|nr:hypothetical protein PFISCL1PPCAC_688 [Pristionchus fissidentatus]